MSKNNETRKNFPWNNLFNVFYFIIFIMIIGILTFSFFIGFFGKNISINVNNDISFSLILTSLAILFASSVIVPKFMLRHEVDNAIISKYENEWKHRISKEIKTIIDSGPNKELWRTDAHLSRMIAFFLTKNDANVYPIWAIGWCFRSLKRYSKLENLGVDEYQDFLKLVRIILRKVTLEFSQKAPSSFSDNIDDIFHKKFFEYILEKIENGSWDSENDEYRTLFRAIKDAIDFEFSLILRLENCEVGTFIDNFKGICMGIGVFIQILFIAYLLNLRERIKSDNKKIVFLEKALNKKVEAKIEEDMFEISDYGNKNNNKEVQNKFRQLFVQLILKLNDKKNQIELVKEHVNLYNDPPKSENNHSIFYGIINL